MASAPDMPPSQQNDGSNPQERNGRSSELSAFFSGTVPEAIAAIQTAQKILVVYIAGMDEDSRKMDQITWQDSYVREVLRQQCVVLCLPHKSSDSLHFAALYPYQEIPTIVLISHTGVLLKQHGGFMSPSEFLVSLEHAASMISIQKAISMVAAVASTSVGSSNPLTLERDQCEGEKLPPRVEGSDLEKPESSISLDYTEILGTAAEDKDSMPPENNAIDQMGDSLPLLNKETCHTEDPSNPMTLEGDECEGEKMPPRAEGSKDDKPESSMLFDYSEILGTAAEDENLMPLENIAVDHIRDSLSLPSKETYLTEPACTINKESNLPTNEAIPESIAPTQAPETLVLKASVNNAPSEAFDSKDSSCSKLADVRKSQNTGSVLLQVRLTNGDSIRKYFNVNDSLAAVKEFVDINRTDGKTSYSFAVAYPRRVFNADDMEKSLLELNLEDRATLILIVNASREARITTVHHRNTYEPAGQMDGAASSGGIWKLLSYLNPFTYFTRGPPVTNDIPSGTSSWQYGPDPTLAQTNRSGQQNLAGPYNSNVPTGEKSGSHSKGPQEKSWGGNIHTLQHGDDSDAFKKGNAFWNGNSTEYGGDDSKK